MGKRCRVHSGLLGLLLGLALAVSACAVHYTKPGASVEDFEADKARAVSTDPLDTSQSLHSTH
jgi:hypothetical protein